MKKVITPQPPDHDSDRVHWQLPDGKEVGFGYVDRERGRIGLIKCPKCLRENYAVAVADGICAFCGFNANTTVNCENIEH